MAKSKYGKLNKSDFWKGLAISMGTGIVVALEQWADTGNFEAINYKMLAMAAIGSGAVYWLKNLGENSKGELLKKENKPDTDNP